MDAEKVLRVVSCVIASIILIFGVVLITGFFIPEHVPSKIRVMMGIIMILFGIYRIIILYIKQRNECDE